MAQDQPRNARRSQALPAVWLLSDARNDAQLLSALKRLPRHSGLIFRHYHLDPPARQRRFAELASHARRHGHMVVLAGSTRLARHWGADGVYGSAKAIGARRAGVLWLATAHNAREIAQAARHGADAVLISPVFSTRSHPGARALGPVRFARLAALSAIPVVALGGMTRERARRLKIARWAAIGGLSAR